MKYISGYRQGMLRVVEKLPSISVKGRMIAKYRCECDCGNVVELTGPELGYVKSCGCLWHNTKPIAPDTMFGHLKVIERTEQKKHGCWVYKCECQCSKKSIVYVRSDNLRNGTTTSCGCVHDELLSEHAKIAYDNSFVFGTSLPKIKYNAKQSNNTSGYPGVSWHKGTGKWCSRIRFQGKNYYLGYYDDVKLAGEAYQIAKKELHGNFLEWYKEKYPNENKRNKRNDKS